MTKPKHTPGPWMTDAEYEHRAVKSDGGVMVAYCNFIRHPSKDRANARLIAAAPDLYEAAQRAALLIEEAIGVPPELKALWAAIKKAEGRT